MTHCSDVRYVQRLRILYLTLLAIAAFDSAIIPRLRALLGEMTFLVAVATGEHSGILGFSTIGSLMAFLST